MSKKVLLEALIASPPTSKCQETMGILEDLICRHPDELRLVVFRRGIDLNLDEASSGMKIHVLKGSPVPAVLVEGMYFSSCKVPDREELEATIQKALAEVA